MQPESAVTGRTREHERMLGDNLARVRGLVAAAATRSGRSPDVVTIVGVSKTVDRPLVDAAYAAGLRHFGENRVQEAVAKFATPLPADASLHLVGQLQTNKAKPAVGLFTIVESVDRPSLVDALAKAAIAAERELAVLIQVNVAGETQKAGCPPDEAAALLERIIAAGNLRPRGLMTIAPLVADPEAVRPVFRYTSRLRDDLARRHPSLDLSILSMGMSDDFAVAVEEGATHLRIGRAIFGERA